MFHVCSYINFNLLNCLLYHRTFHNPIPPPPFHSSPSNILSLYPSRPTVDITPHNAGVTQIQVGEELTCPVVVFTPDHDTTTKQPSTAHRQFRSASPACSIRAPRNVSMELLHQDLTQRLSLPPYPDPNNNGNVDKASSIKGDKYSLRPRSVRRRNHVEDVPDDDAGAVVSKSQPRAAKQKQKPAPLSKYRRKTANARERSRMREINQAFEALRRAVPQMTTQHAGNNEKLTKITTLRLAMKYISTLSAVLSGENDASCPDLLSDCSELDCFLLESDGESLPLHSDLSDHSLTPGDFSVDFIEDSLTPVDFTPLSPNLIGDHFDPFLGDFS